MKVLDGIPSDLRFGTLSLWKISEEKVRALAEKKQLEFYIHDELRARMLSDLLGVSVQPSEEVPRIDDHETFLLIDFAGNGRPTNFYEARLFLGW